MELGYMQNGTKKRKRRRNPAAKVAAKAKNPATTARRVTSLAQAKAAAKRNGLKLVARGTAQNGKRKGRRRRNGVTAQPVGRSRNGFFGNTKADLKNVVALGGGLFGVKAISKALVPVLMPYMAQVGAGQYTEAAVEAALALFLAPWAGNKIGGKGAGDMARLGGIFTAVLSAVDAFSPGLLSNPFASPIVMSASGPAINTNTVKQLAQDVANSANPQAAAAQIAGALDAIDAGAGYNDFAGARGSMIPIGTF